MFKYLNHCILLPFSSACFIFSDFSLLSFFSLSLFKTHCSSMPDPMDPVEFTISPLPQEIAKDFNDHACLQSGKRIAVPVIKTYSKSKGNI